MSNESRRKLLKSIAAGSGAIVAGKSLPESWSRPIVDSVLLPAHATTSQATLVIAGATRVCGDSDFITEYYIDHNGAVPVLVQASAVGLADRIAVGGSRPVNSVRLTVYIAVNSYTVDLSCTLPSTGAATNWVLPVIDTAGVGWTAVFTLSRLVGPSSLVRSDIVLTQN